MFFCTGVFAEREVKQGRPASDEQEDRADEEHRAGKIAPLIVLSFGRGG
jgi:hypothetical protein